jgi:hypothetical protein
MVVISSSSSVYHVLADEKDYGELGGKYFDEWNRQAVQIKNQFT